MRWKSTSRACVPNLPTPRSSAPCAAWDIALMSLKVDPPTSIHRRLLVLLLPPLALLMLAGGFADYRASMFFMRTAYDQSLADAAFAQAARVKVTDGRIYAQLPPPAQSGVHTH